MPIALPEDATDDHHTTNTTRSSRLSSLHGAASAPFPSTTMEMRQTGAGPFASTSTAGPGSIALGSKSASYVDPRIHRPPVYYGEGTFDPPSSDDEDEFVDARAGGGPGGGGGIDDDVEDERVSLLTLDKSAPSTPGRAERGDGSGSGRRPEQEQKHSNVRVLAIALLALVSLATVIGIIAGFLYSGSAFHGRGSKRLTMDHVFNGTFSQDYVGVNWVAEAGDGVFSQFQGGNIYLVDLKTNETKLLVDGGDIRNEQGSAIPIDNWKLSDDMSYLLIKTDYVKQWRHSSHGNFYIHNILEKRTYPLSPPTNPPQIAYATWSPTGNSIAYVSQNDLYILPSAADPKTPALRITSTGNTSLFNGVPDWVYEEEVFSADFALWWSPDSKKVAFLSFDETAVPEFTFPIYNPTEDASTIVPYTGEVRMKYPKPGYPNPLVEVHVFDLGRYQEDVAKGGAGGGGAAAIAAHTLTLNWADRQVPTESIVMEVAWVGNATLLIKEVNRNADKGLVAHFDLEESTAAARAQGDVVRRLGKEGEQGDAGWIDSEQTVFPIPGSKDGAYLDVVPTKEGYNHIALFDKGSAGQPKWLTGGKWEVTGGIKGVDRKNGVVYFVAANPSSLERHVYKVDLKSATGAGSGEEKPEALTDTGKASFYSASFSPEAGFYVLNYGGPSVPWSKVMKTDNSTFEHILTTNERLQNATLEYESATIQHTTFVHEGYELNAVELRPPRMDDSGRTKYPVLFRVYGGPASQLVDLNFRRDWHHYLACGMEYIVVTVDGRGTGFKGRHLRNPVKGNLGFWETRDQIAAAKEWASRPYVDKRRIGIWGWSYGGFMASKVAEANAGVHSLAMAVAPVTSWRLYDSIYTERYMDIPERNQGGYVNASISKVEGFKHLDFLLAHGSGDDNVHYANSAHLLDMFTQQRVRGFWFRMFTDSDHSIYRRGANREVYEYLTLFLREKWGKGARHV